MPTNLPNRAQLTYSYGDEQNTVLSNQTNTTLVDQYTMSLTKTVLAESVRPGENVQYILRLENTGAGALYNPTIIDDLGSPSDVKPLKYTATSARFYINGDPVVGNVDISDTEITFTLASVLQPGDNLIIAYNATLSPNSTEAVTNNAEATANSGSAEGPAINASASATVTPMQYADVSIFKTADKTSVVSGDTLTYTFTMLNTGTAAAESVSFSDALPSEFTVTGISYTVNGDTTQLTAADYNITPGNVLTIPEVGSRFAIEVPAATAEGPGSATITVTGTVA